MKKFLQKIDEFLTPMAFVHTAFFGTFLLIFLFILGFATPILPVWAFMGVLFPFGKNALWAIPCFVILIVFGVLFVIAYIRAVLRKGMKLFFVLSSINVGGALVLALIFSLTVPSNAFVDMLPTGLLFIAFNALFYRAGKIKSFL